jgi:N-acetylglucosaminyl-diphospho-decaprenol L-rhamnosyltransferase
MNLPLSILVISYNTRDLTLACIASVLAETRTENEIIVLDNASADGSADAIAERFPRVHLIRSERNLGFAAGNNAAGRHATGEWLLLLNPDTRILDQAVDKALAFALAQPGEVIVGGRTFFEDGSLNPTSCHGAPTPWSVLSMGLGLSALFRGSRCFDSESLGPWQRDTVREVDAITGCFLLIRRRIWNELHGFDEAFFMYGEETDLCLRANQRGVRCLVCPGATLIHHGGASEAVRSDKLVKLFKARRQLFERHWHPLMVAFGVSMLKLWALTRTIAWGVLALMSRTRADRYATWREVWGRRSEYSLRPRRSREEARG